MEFEKGPNFIASSVHFLPSGFSFLACFNLPSEAVVPVNLKTASYVIAVYDAV